MREIHICPDCGADVEEAPEGFHCTCPRCGCKWGWGDVREEPQEKTTSQYLAETLTDRTLGARLFTLSKDMRRFTRADREAFLREAAKRLGHVE